MTKHNLSIVKYNKNAFLDYIKNKDMNQLVDSMNDIDINDNNNECMLCKKLKQKLGKNRFMKTLKCVKDNKI
jgi:hypothetical protein